MPRNSWFWMSFAGEEGNRGCCMVQGINVRDAHARATMLGINPGGEVRIQQLPHFIRPKHEWRNVLISKEVAEESNDNPGKFFDADAGYTLTPANDPDCDGVVNPPSQHICNDCNCHNDN